MKEIYESIKQHRLDTTRNALNNAMGEEKEKLNREYLHNKELVNKWTKNYITFSKKNNLRTQMDRTIGNEKFG